MARGNHTGHFFCPPSASPHPITASSSTEFKIHNSQFGQLLQQAYLTWNMSIYICAKYQHLVFVARCPLFMMIHSTSEVFIAKLQTLTSKFRKFSSFEQLGKGPVEKSPTWKRPQPACSLIWRVSIWPDCLKLSKIGLFSCPYPLPASSQVKFTSAMLFQGKIGSNDEDWGIHIRQQVGQSFRILCLLLF